MPTLGRLYGGQPVRLLWPNALADVAPIPRDGTQLREENGAIWVVGGSARFHVPDMPTLQRLYGSSPIGQLWDGAVTQIPSTPIDGSLFKQETRAPAYVFSNGWKTPLRTATHEQPFVIWDGGLDAFPTTLRPLAEGFERRKSNRRASLRLRPRRLKMAKAGIAAGASPDRKAIGHVLPV